MYLILLINHNPTTCASKPKEDDSPSSWEKTPNFSWSLNLTLNLLNFMFEKSHHTMKVHSPSLSYILKLFQVTFHSALEHSCTKFCKRNCHISCVNVHTRLTILHVCLPYFSISHWFLLSFLMLNLLLPHIVPELACCWHHKFHKPGQL